MERTLESYNTYSRITTSSAKVYKYSVQQTPLLVPPEQNSRDGAEIVKYKLPISRTICWREQAVTAAGKSELDVDVDWVLVSRARLVHGVERIVEAVAERAEIDLFVGELHWNRHLT